MSAADALRIIEGHWRLEGATPLAVCSVNLDHVHHFGTGARWHGTGSHHAAPGERAIEWLNLVDGAPVAKRLERATGTPWPRLAGSDLIGPILERAQANGLSVGFFGGSAETHERLRAQLALERPALRLSGCWAPGAHELADPARSRELAAGIRAAGTDILVVCLGKPRQEVWIAEYGALTGARTLLAFGAVVDFLAGRVDRAPRWVAGHGLEWAWRLAMEPRRLARRYLVQGPPAYLAVRRSPIQPIPMAIEDAKPAAPLAHAAHAEPAGHPEGRFCGPDETADVTVVTVTYNSARHIDGFVESLRAEAREVRLRLVVADNGSGDDTLERIAADDVTIVRTGGNLGYAGGINAALPHAGRSEAVLVLNPDLTVLPGSVRALLDRMRRSGAGVVVPAIREENGRVYTSLRREPSTLRALGDALFGERVTRRGAAFSEIDWDETSYRFPHRVDWATGAALLVRRDLADRLGGWDERFFLFSEETEYFRRARDAGETVWFAPEATVVHTQGGSGIRPEFTALMAVNRVRYAEATGGAAKVAGIHAMALLHEGLRSYQPAHRAAFRTLLSRRSWARLPHAEAGPAEEAEAAGPAAPAEPAALTGSIIIPAHNEAAVIGRTLKSLAPAAAEEGVEVIVACNGCTDDTARIAAEHPGITVLDLPEPSKTAALNAADEAATRWPRLYLDADIDITPEAIHAVFSALERGDALAARPAFRYDTRGCSPLVRAYYRARQRGLGQAAGLWGAGAYAVGRDGHSRFGSFPTLIADDLWIDQQFTAAEKRVLATSPVRVRTPRTERDLLAVLRRTHRGNAELGADTAGSTLRRVLSGVRGPSSALDAMIYAAFAVGARWSRPTAAWESDRSTREAAR